MCRLMPFVSCVVSEMDAHTHSGENNKHPPALNALDGGDLSDFRDDI